MIRTRSSLIAITMLALITPLTATAQTTRTAPEPPAGELNQCSFEGEAYLDHNVPIYSDRQGGTHIATLTGMPVKLRLSEFPAERDAGRARVVSGGSVEISGFVEPGRVHLISQEPISVRTGMWIAPATDLNFLAARPDAVLVQKRFDLLESPSVEVWAECNQLGLDMSGVAPTAVPEGAVAHLARRRGPVAVYERAVSNSPVVASLKAPGYSDGLLFWVTHESNGFSKVLYKDEVIVEGWLRSKSLARVTGSDSIEPSRRQGLSRRLPNLQVSGEPRLFKAKRKLPLRIRAFESAATVGFLMPTTEVFVVDEISDWVGVVPKALDIVAPGGGQFWVPASLVAKP